MIFQFWMHGVVWSFICPDLFFFLLQQDLWQPWYFVCELKNLFSAHFSFFFFFNCFEMFWRLGQKGLELRQSQPFALVLILSWAEPHRCQTRSAPVILWNHVELLFSFHSFSHHQLLVWSGFTGSIWVSEGGSEKCHPQFEPLLVFSFPVETAHPNPSWRQMDINLWKLTVSSCSLPFWPVSPHKHLINALTFLYAHSISCIWNAEMRFFLPIYIGTLKKIHIITTILCCSVISSSLTLLFEWCVPV